jgi:hypothetical protein
MPFYHIGQQSLQWLQNYVKGATALAGAGFMKSCNALLGNPVA